MRAATTRIPIAAAFAAALAACQTVPGDLVQPQTDDTDPTGRDAAAFQTDAQEYRVTVTSHWYETAIGFTFTNPTGAPAYIVNCRGATSLLLEKWTGSEWTSVWSPVIPSCLSPPIVVQPGDTYSGAIHMVAGLPGNNLYPKFNASEVAGTYRLVWGDVLRSYNPNAYPFGDPLPLEHRVSNSFVLELDP